MLKKEKTCDYCEAFARWVVNERCTTGTHNTCSLCLVVCLDENSHDLNSAFVVIDLQNQH